MPKIRKNYKNLELKIELQKVLENLDLFEIILNRDVVLLKRKVQDYKPLIKRLENIETKDFELVYLIGQVLSKYYFIEKMIKKIEEQNHFDVLINGVIINNDIAFEILTKLYSESNVSKRELSESFNKDDSEYEDLIISMQNMKILEEDKRNRFYSLSSAARRYIKETYCRTNGIDINEPNRKKLKLEMINNEKEK